MNERTKKMADFERYGDYNEVDEPPKRGKVLILIKIIALVLCFSVVGLLLFRVFTFNHYPPLMKDIYFTDALTEYYNATGGDIGAKTQNLRAPYDDADKGNFFCDNLIVVEGAGNMQISVRYNKSLYDEIYRTYGVKLDPENQDIFRFSLAKNGTGEGVISEPLDAELTATLWDSFMMYRYAKLVFDGVDFEGAKWIRLEITIDGVDRKEPFVIPIYENNDDHNSFKEYKLSSSEAPKK